MTTLRKLIDAGLPLDAELVSPIDEDDDHAWSLSYEIRTVDAPGDAKVIVLYRGSGCIPLADANDYGVNYVIERNEASDDDDPNL